MWNAWSDGILGPVGWPVTKLAREVKVHLTPLSLIEFFKKMKKWLEMARLPQSFQSKIEALERKFEVASIIYDKYRKVFKELFDMNEEKAAATASATPTRPRGRKPNQ